MPESTCSVCFTTKCSQMLAGSTLVGVHFTRENEDDEREMEHQSTLGLPEDLLVNVLGTGSLSIIPIT